MQLGSLIEEVKRSNAAVEKKKLEEIEQHYFVWRATGKPGGAGGAQSSLASEIAAARKHIGDVLKDGKTAPAHSDAGAGSGKDSEKISKLEKEQSSMRQEISELRRLVEAMRLKIDELSTGKTGGQPAKAAAAALPSTKPKPKAQDSDDDVDLFGSDEEEDSEKTRIRDERLKAYADKKSTKPGLIAKSSVILDVKPWDDETDMKELEKCVRSVQMDGLLWGASKFMPVGYGIQKLQISVVVEDDKVSVEELTEKISEFEEFIQSVDIAAFNKI
jgi:translation elongation factor EF-1beta